VLTLRLALSVSHEALRREVSECLREVRAEVVADCREHSSWRGFLVRLAQTQPQLVLLDLTALPVELEDAVAGIRLAASASVAALNVTADPESVLRAVRAGANDYLFPPLGSNLRRTVERKLQEARLADGPRGCGKVMGFLSAKGGCGATTIACCVAAELGRRCASHGRRALMADFDLDAGVAAEVLKASASRSVLDAIHSLQRPEAQKWCGVASPAADGLDMLAAAPVGSPREAFDGGALREMLEFARGDYEWVVADLGRGWSAVAFDLLGMADQGFLVFTADVPALNQTRQMLELVRQHGVPEEKLRLVLNRASRAADLRVPEIERVMGAPVFAMVPEERAADLPELSGATARQLRALAERVK
jgi:pilus assembly protein CpaE